MTNKIIGTGPDTAPVLTYKHLKELLNRLNNDQLEQPIASYDGILDELDYSTVFVEVGSVPEKWNLKKLKSLMLPDDQLLLITNVDLDEDDLEDGVGFDAGIPFITP